MSDPPDLPRFDRLVVIIASSRSGSSFLFDLLRRSGAFLSLPGEHTPLYRRYGMLEDGSGAGDARFRQALRRSVSTGLPAERTEPADRARCIVRTLRRQWGFALTGAEEVALTALRAAAGSRPGRPDHLDDFVDVVTALRAAGIPIDPWYYDLDPVLVCRRFPGVPRPTGPPRRCIELESTPLLVPRSERLPTGAELHRPLLLKATVDAYRIESLLRIFAGAEIEFVQLTRNPAASINGLIDGWLSPAFFSCRLPGRPLRIAGYTTEQAWTQSWWNFDLPPHWPELVDRPLAQVCRDQWAAAQAAMRQSLQANRIPAAAGASRAAVGSVHRARATAPDLRTAAAATAPPAGAPDRDGHQPAVAVAVAAPAAVDPAAAGRRRAGRADPVDRLRLGIIRSLDLIVTTDCGNCQAGHGLPATIRSM